MVLESTPNRRAEVYRFPLAALVLVPVAILVIQTYLPLYFRAANIADLPLLVVIYFALARRSPVAGLLAGAVIGTVQDSLSRDPIGLFAVTDTVIGYIASLVSNQMEAENSAVRFLIVFVLYYLRLGCLYLLGSFLLGETLEPSLKMSAIGALVNGFIAVLLFKVLDRFRQPA